MAGVHTLRAAAGAVSAGAVVGGALLGYALWEARQYTLRQVQVPVLPSGTGDIHVLHISDLHLTGNTEHRVQWVAGLAALEPDLVVVTGDFLSSPDGVDRVGATLGGLLDVPGVFVFGSNDYFAAKPINPAKYLRGPSKRYRRALRLDTPRMLRTLTSGGWCPLNNETAVMEIAGLTFAFAGAGDAHHRLDSYAEVASTWPADADVRVGVTHAPYLRVLDAMADDGADLIFAGHTHGGQVCLPNGLALVTNCDLEPDRAKGLSRHGDAWLHVSAGLGTNPYSPIRMACRPEATLLRLTPRSQSVPQGESTRASGAV